MQKKGKLELTWVGKYDEEKPVEPRILIEDKEKSYGDPNSENMLIHGDNLIALQALQQDFSGKIKCIYIEIIIPSLIQSAEIIKKCAFAV
jgi:adenine-specific DNA-methyltransferase